MQNMIVSKALLDDIFAYEPAYLQKAHLWSRHICLNIDSRIALPHSIFFAIKGELHDGHDFIDDAITKGASLIVAQKPLAKSVPVIVVENSLNTFSQIAHRHLMSMPALRIGLTGSNGKTTVKEMLRAALSAVLGADAVFANDGTFNNHFGVPISALQVRSHHKVAIFEMGMNHEGEIRDLCQIVLPTVGLITNIGVAHEGNFTNGIDGVQAAKGELFETVRSAVINLDDERIVNEASRHHFMKSIGFGTSPKADVWLIKRKPYNIDTGLQNLRMGIKGRHEVDFAIPMPGIHHAHNAIAALAVVKALDLDIEKASAGLATMTTTLGRMSLKQIGQTLLINDAYNANPASMKAGILACREFDAPRRIAVIGAMGELGALSEHYHFELGELLAEHFHTILVCGKPALSILKGAESLGPEKLIYKNTSEELIEPLRSIMHHHDLIFIKGSKSAKMQVIAHALLEQR